MPQPATSFETHVEGEVANWIHAAPLPSLAAGPLDEKMCQWLAGNPMTFVDRCEAAIRIGGTNVTQCQQSQWLEWQLLYLHCDQ